MLACLAPFVVQVQLLRSALSGGAELLLPLLRLPPFPRLRRLQLERAPPGGGGSQRCTATLRASSMLPPGLSVGYALGASGLM